MFKTDSILPQQSKTSLVDKAREYTQVLIHIKESTVQNFLDAGRIFKEIKEEELWKLEGAESFNSYIAEVGYDRTTAFKMILVHETFGKELVDSNQQILEAGWVKLAKVAPHTDERNYDYMLELASTSSLSDIDKELVRQNYITKKETESEFIECPYCHKSFVPLKRQDKAFPQEDYKKVIEVYKKAKGIEPKGKEYDPIQQSIKTMFLNGRTSEQIIATIEYLADQEDYSWTIHTVKNKIAEILPELNIKPKKEMSEEDKLLLKGSGLKV